MHVIKILITCHHLSTLHWWFRSGPLWKSKTPSPVCSLEADQYPQFEHCAIEGGCRISSHHQSWTQPERKYLLVHLSPLHYLPWSTQSRLRHKETSQMISYRLWLAHTGRCLSMTMCVCGRGSWGGRNDITIIKSLSESGEKCFKLGQWLSH